jgi:hypothetical protein
MLWWPGKCRQDLHVVEFQATSPFIEQLPRGQSTQSKHPSSSKRSWRVSVMGLQNVMFWVSPEPQWSISQHFLSLCLAPMQDSSASEVQPSWLDWFEHNRNLFIRGHSLKELCLAAKSQYFLPRRAAGTHTLDQMTNCQGTKTQQKVWCEGE